MGPLKNIRRESFCIRYVSTGNATQSYKDAGYRWKNDRSAASAASALLTFLDVKRRVEELTAERWKKEHMSADELLTRVARRSRADIRGLYHEDGSLKKPSELDDVTAAGIAGIEVELVLNDDGPPLAVKKYKMHNPAQSDRLLAQHHKIIGADVQVNITEDLAAKLAAARKRARERGAKS